MHTNVHKMKQFELYTFMALTIINLAANVVLAGTPCPEFGSIQPCYCSMTSSDKTTMICAALTNDTELVTVTESMKSMIVDHMLLLGCFKESLNISTKETDVDDVEDVGVRLPEKWLAATRVRELEVQNSRLSNCFLCNDPFDGQEDFLVFLSVTHSSLKGHLCSSCSNKAVTTRFLSKMKNLKTVDFSFNSIEIVAGNAFPGTLVNLNRIILSNNKITKVYDNAFSNINQLKELDLSHNKLTSVTRKMLRIADNTLQSLDLSWNSIQALPEDIFLNLKGLKEVNLSHNLLEVIQATTISRMNLQMEKIDVEGNFLVCNCSMSWIGKKLSKNTKIVGSCVTPKEVEFQELKATLTSFQPCR